MNVRPLPGPLPQEREKRPPRSETLVIADNKSSSGAPPFSLSPGERAGVRASVTSKIEFTLATEGDDAGIRRLLCDNPMAGQISLSLEREPDFFREARHSGAGQQTIVARDGGRVVCVGTCSFRQRFVNGEPRRVGYLGGLRLDARLGGRSDILRRGYRFFHELQRAHPADFYFTAIAVDNERARLFLERGLPGMPRYEPLGDFITVLIPVPRSRWRNQADATSFNPPPSIGGYEPISALLEEHGRRCQFAPCWTAEELQALLPLGLRTDDFRVLSRESKAVACAALWDQRSFKQAVIRAYATPLAWARPWINVAARLLGRPGLPSAGSTLAHAAVSHLAAPSDQPDVIPRLVQSLFPLARSKGLEWLTLGFAATDPRLALLRGRFAAREYRSRLYRVSWPDLPGDALDDRLPCPEAALL